eukprot:CAMPEP_0117550552 /NCGR_PEP_ID=MMETSP0784-20121206/48740_1 /TAXON_ID=39447 /ORGANISM="" /LENGTH=387 /DNA_ID=CAMNT_0005347575 /DNA_START=36 /DNA_END=1196 /DNA_ORIENTATION=-
MSRGLASSVDDDGALDKGSRVVSGMLSSVDDDGALDRGSRVVSSMLINLPSQLVSRALSFCSPAEWGRATVAHRLLQIPKDQLLLAAGYMTAEPSTTLGEAARAGLLHLVFARLWQGVNPNERDRNHPKYTPLHRAVSGGNRLVVRLLLSMKATASSRDRLGFCALHFAAIQSEGIVSDLLQAQCEVNAKNLQGLTPLHSAAGMGRAKICTLLLEAGAQPITGYMLTPSQMASRVAEKRIGSAREELLALADMLSSTESAAVVESACPTTWCYQVNNSGDAIWQPYDDESAKTLEQARLSGETELFISARGNQYHVNLDMLTQTNVDTGIVRAISLQPARSAETSWAPAAPGHWEGIVSTGASRDLPSERLQRLIPAQWHSSASNQE